MFISKIVNGKTPGGCFKAEKNKFEAHFEKDKPQICQREEAAGSSQELLASITPEGSTQIFSGKSADSISPEHDNNQVRPQRAAERGFCVPSPRAEGI